MYSLVLGDVVGLLVMLDTNSCITYPGFDASGRLCGALKSPSHVPEKLDSRLPLLPADEKYRTPFAVTVLTAVAITPSWNGDSVT